MSGEDEQGRKPFFGQRLGGVKVHRTGERHPRRGERIFHTHHDGSFNTNNEKEMEDGQMEMTQAERAEKLKEIEQRAEAFRRENPEAAARAEQEQRAWAAEQAEKLYGFEAAVAKLRATGMSLSDSVRKVAAENPALHDDYLTRSQTGQVRPLS